MCAGTLFESRPSLTSYEAQCISNWGGDRHQGLKEDRFPYFSQLMRNVMMTMVSLNTLSHSNTPCSPPPRRPTFAVLPDEIIVSILEWCNFKGVLACQRVRASPLTIYQPPDCLPSLAVTPRRAALSKMSSWVRQAYGINSLSPNTECATGRRAI